MTSFFQKARPEAEAFLVRGWRAIFEKALLFACGALLLGMAGCQHAKTASEPTTPLVWPESPDEPRIAYVKTVHSAADFGVKSSGFVRFGRWLTGSDKGKEALLKPFGVALDENDNLCLTDTGANVVCYYDRAKQKWKRWERVGTIRFSSPVAVAKRSGMFFVADSGLARVVAFDEEGKLLRQITNRLERPCGVVILENRLFVTDSQRHRVVVFDLAGAYQFEFGERGLGPGQFNYPTHITADAQGNLFVTDSMNSRVQVLDSQGRFRRQIGRIGDSTGDLSRPKGVGVDSFGHVYVIDALFDNIQVFNQEGKLLLYLGQTGSGRGEFWLPNGIAVSGRNEIFVTDSYNRRLQVLQYIGGS